VAVFTVGGWRIADANSELDARRRMCIHFREELLAALRPFQPVIHGDEGRSLPHVVNLSFPGLSADQVIDALTPLSAASDGAAFTSICSTPSHVLTAMGLPTENVDGGIRLSLGYSTVKPDWLRFSDALQSALAVLGTARHPGDRQPLCG
jgi:cysteine desulfurase